MVEEKPAFDVRIGHKLTVKGNSTGRRQKIAGLQLARQPANRASVFYPGECGPVWVLTVRPASSDPLDDPGRDKTCSIGVPFVLFLSTCENA
jgi:hypothetical protein